MKKTRKRNQTSNANTQYENLEARQLLAVSAVLDGGNLQINLTEAADVATLTTIDGEVTVNGTAVDGDASTAGIQSVSVGQVNSIEVIGAAGVNDATINLNGAFNTGALNSVSLQNINRGFIGGSYVTNSLTGNFVGDDGFFVDVGTGSIVVNGFTGLNSSDEFDFSFNGANNDFAGAINFSTEGNIEIVDENTITLNAISTNNLTLIAASAINDTTNANIFVSNQTNLTAGSVNLGDESSTVDLFTLTANTDGLFALDNTDFLSFQLDSVLGSADISSGDLVTTGRFASLEIVGDAIFDVNRLRLGVGGSNTFNTGRLNVNSDLNAFVFEDSGVQLFGSNTAPDLDIISRGSISNDPGTTINVSGITGLQSTQTIDIGNAAGDTFNSGLLRFFGNQVSINEDSSTIISGLANFAVDLDIESNGFISDTANAFVVVNENATFISAVDDAMANAGVLLGDSENDFFVAGSISFDVTDGNFNFTENNSTTIASPDGFENQANAINIFSGGDLISGTGAQIDIDTTATLAGDNISIGQGGPDDNVQLGSVNLNTPGNAIVDLESNVFLTGNANVGGNVLVVSDGSIVDGNQSFFNSGGNAQFFGANITLGDMDAPISAGEPGDLFSVGGTLRFGSGGAVSIAENGNILLAADTQTASVLNLTSIATDVQQGTINSQDDTTVTVQGNLFVTASANINLGQGDNDSVNFANLNFNANGNVNINAIFEDPNNSFFIFGTSNNPNAASELRLTTNVDVFDGTSAVIDIDEFVRVEARNITFGDTDTDCVMLPSLAANNEFVTTDGAPSIITDATCTT